MSSDTSLDHKIQPGNKCRYSRKLLQAGVVQVRDDVYIRLMRALRTCVRLSGRRFHRCEEIRIVLPEKIDI